MKPTLILFGVAVFLIQPIGAAPVSSSTGKIPAGVMLPGGEMPAASGSGVIVSRTGHVLTAAHVVAGAKNIRILTAQGVKMATVLRTDEANDLAVLKLAAGSYPALPIGPAERVRLGQPVATIGFPNIDFQGFSPKVTRGEISSLNGFADDPHSWQISVPVQPGNSGGALLDEYGNVIGVVVSKLGLKAAKVTGDIPQNVNYAVKSTQAFALLKPFLDSSAPGLNQPASSPRFEDMVAKAQESVVLVLVYGPLSTKTASNAERTISGDVWIFTKNVGIYKLPGAKVTAYPLSLLDTLSSYVTAKKAEGMTERDAWMQALVAFGPVGDSAVTDSQGKFVIKTKNQAAWVYCSETFRVYDHDEVYFWIEPVRGNYVSLNGENVHR